MSVETPFSMALIAGGCAGTSVDVALYPMDTIRTRSQSTEGFWRAGGFRCMHKGLMVAALGSAPGAAVFFSAYENFKSPAKKLYGRDSWIVHSAAASAAEVVSCFVRVPTAIVTQRMQVGQYARFGQAVRGIYAEGGARAFYAGFYTTCVREVAFAFIQFPIYEYLKTRWAAYQRRDTTPMQGAACGSTGGLIAGMLTTPLDLVNTRIMLDRAIDGQRKYKNVCQSLMKISSEEGLRTLFSGMGARCAMLSLGGFFFFGAYEQSLYFLRTTGRWE